MIKTKYQDKLTLWVVRFGHNLETEQQHELILQSKEDVVYIKMAVADRL